MMKNLVRRRENVPELQFSFFEDRFGCFTQQNFILYFWLISCIVVKEFLRTKRTLLSWPRFAVVSLRIKGINMK